MTRNQADVEDLTQRTLLQLYESPRVEWRGNKKLLHWCLTVMVRTWRRGRWSEAIGSWTDADGSAHPIPVEVVSLDDDDAWEPEADEDQEGD